MGDTGSLLIGLLMVVQVIEFMEFNMNSALAINFSSSPSLALAIVIIPITDTLRVFTLRIMKGLSPFFPDKNHVHHCLLRIYNRHYKVTLALILINILIITVTALLCMVLTSFVSLIFVVLAMGILFASVLPSAIMAYRSKKHGKFWFRIKQGQTIL